MSHASDQSLYQNVTMVQAIRQALDDAMADDHTVMLAGEDIGVNGGVFRATEGLLTKYGEKRVLDSPLAEGLLGGMGVGLSLQGLKPVIEFQFSGFIFPAMEQIIAHAARMRNRTRGRLSCPIVYRAPYSGGIHAPEHHSESPEALFAHIPGLRVIIPSTPGRAYGLLRAAIACPDPVIFLEPKKIYHSQKQTIEPDHAMTLETAWVDRTGHDVTLIGWGAMMPMLRKICDDLHDAIAIELIDFSTLKPFDAQCLIQSVRKTGRLVVVHEAPKHGGLAAEIMALVAEHAMHHLIAPMKRVTGFDTTMPYFKHEQFYLPSAQRVVHAINQVMEYQYV